ncbi:MAG TPA: protein YgfX [Azonexus sp.]|nr:protein YgfX [Azonexus sp.]
MQFPIIIGLHRSRILDGVLLSTAVLAISAFATWPQTLAIRLAGIAAVAAGCYAAWRQLKPELGFIKLERSGRIFASHESDAEFKAMDVRTGASVHPWLTVIRFQDESGKRHTLLATQDTMNPEDFRRLRVFLRWRAKFSGPENDA